MSPMTTTCTVIVSASGARCGAEAVSVREGIFGGTIAECAAHFVPAAAPAAPAGPVGAMVEIHWHTWAKRGEVVGERGRRLEVRFVPRAGAEAIVRAFPREDVTFL